MFYVVCEYFVMVNEGKINKRFGLLSQIRFLLMDYPENGSCFFLVSEERSIYKCLNGFLSLQRFWGQSGGLGSLWRRKGTPTARGNFFEIIKYLRLNKC
jgi:hypothetical protein